jgi:phospholipid transport system transporter-binding protein
VIKLDGNVMQVKGRLTLETSPALFNQGLPTLEGGAELVVDLGEVEAVDSSAISLMLAWLRLAQAKQVKLSFANVPPNLISLANLYSVTEILSFPSVAAGG